MHSEELALAALCPPACAQRTHEQRNKQTARQTKSAVRLQEGFYVDGPHLAEQDAKAQADLADAEGRFRAWLRRYAPTISAGCDAYGLHPDDVPGLVNLSSSCQIQTLLFGGFVAAAAVEKKPLKAAAAKGEVAQMVKPKVDIVRCQLPLCLCLCCTSCLSLCLCAFPSSRGRSASEGDETCLLT